MTTTQTTDYTSNNTNLYIGLELSKHKWLMGCSINLAKIMTKSLTSWDMAGFLQYIQKTKDKLGLSPECSVKICFEAGLDGFSVYRTLKQYDFEVYVIDSASIELNRKKRKAKTDSIDVRKLTQLLYRYEHGEKNCLKPIRIPSVEEEDLRRVHREYEQLQTEQNRHINRIMSIMALHGIKIKNSEIKRKDFEKRLKDGEFKAAWGNEIGCHALQGIRREYERYKLVKQQLLDLKAYCRDYVKQNPESKVAIGVNRLSKVKGVGFWGAWKLLTEWFAWREFNNRKEVGSAAGLTGVPFASGELDREQGISKAGNKRIRYLIMELAWLWLIYQPNSHLSQWFMDRFGQGKRVRRIGIVALARKLLITFWRYLSKGILPEDIELKAVEA